MFFVLHRCTYIINYKQAYFTLGCEVNLAVKAFNYLSRKKKMKSTKKIIVVNLSLVYTELI